MCAAEAKPLFSIIKLTAAPKRNRGQLAKGPNEEHLFELSLDVERIKSEPWNI